MQKFILRTIALIAFFACANLATAQKTLPSIEVKTLEGKTVDLKSYAENGKVTVLSFWATWCAPCKKELDAVADLYPDWKRTYEVEVVAVSIDTRRQFAKVPGIVATKGWEYEVLSDTNQKSQQALNFQTIPMTVVLDKEGNIAYTHNSYTPGDEYELEDKIKELSK